MSRYRKSDPYTTSAATSLAHGHHIRIYPSVKRMAADPSEDEYLVSCSVCGLLYYVPLERFMAARPHVCEECQYGDAP